VEVELPAGAANHQIERGKELAPASDVEKLAANVEALELLSKLETPGPLGCRLSQAPDQISYQPGLFTHLSDFPDAQPRSAA
jgi:hypothetical protein